MLITQAGLEEKEVTAAIFRPIIRSNVKIVRPQMFNREAGRVLGFWTVYKLFIRIKIWDIAVEEQIQ